METALRFNPELSPPPPAPTAVLPQPDKAEAVWRFHVSGKDPDTVRAYTGDWNDLGNFCIAQNLVNAATHATPGAAARSLILLAGAGAAAALLRVWLADARERLASSTCERRLAAYESFLKDACRFGAIDWEHDGKSVGKRPRGISYKNTAGPGAAGFKRMMATLTEDTPRNRRDRAVLWLLYGLSLRRESVATLNVGSLTQEDDGSWHLAYFIKGADETRTKRVPLPILKALLEHLETRGHTSPEDPMFVGIQVDGSAGKRLSGAMIWKTTRRIGEAAGVTRSNPHAFRHAGATEALRATKNLAAVQKLLDHESTAHTQRYLDNLEDLGNEAAEAAVSAARLVW